MLKKRLNKIAALILSMWLLVGVALPTTVYAASPPVISLYVGNTNVFNSNDYGINKLYYWKTLEASDFAYEETLSEDDYLFSVEYDGDNGLTLTMNDMEILSYYDDDYEITYGIYAANAKLNIKLNGEVLIGNDERPYYGIHGDSDIYISSQEENSAIIINAEACGISAGNAFYTNAEQLTVDVNGFENYDSAFGISAHGNITIIDTVLNVIKRGQKGDAINSWEDIRILGNADVSIVDWSTGDSKCGLHSKNIAIGGNAKVDICSQATCINASEETYIGYEWNGVNYITSGSAIVTLNNSDSIESAEDANSGAKFNTGKSISSNDLSVSGGRLKAIGGMNIDNSKNITLPDVPYFYKSSDDFSEPGEWENSDYGDYEYDSDHKYIEIASTYTVTYNLNVGEDVEKYIYGEGLTLEAPAKANYIFAGWYEQPDFSGSPVIAITPTDMGDKIFYAKWIAKTLVSIKEAPQVFTYDGSIKYFTIKGMPETDFIVTYNQDSVITTPSAVGSYNVEIHREEDETYLSYSKIIMDGLVITPASAPSVGSKDSNTSKSIYNAEVKSVNGKETTLPVTVNKLSRNASIDVSSQKLISGGIDINAPYVPGVDTYSVGIPVKELQDDGQNNLNFNTDMGSITVATNMLTSVESNVGNKAQIFIGTGDKSALPNAVKDAIGDKPLIQLKLVIDGKQINWNNPNAPVTVRIPYAPTAKELETSESIIVWYIDSSGNVVTIPNGRYDAENGTVIFETIHFSNYAISYNNVTFNDVAMNAWYHKAVNFIAARSITEGTSGGSFSPDAKLTRGEFLVLLMRTYGIVPDKNLSDNFSDAGDTYYTSYLATAKNLGISNGVGNNIYAPEREITRQEMFSLLYNTLKVIGELPQGDSAMTLSDFTDSSEVADWAKEAMELLIEEKVIRGNNRKLTPLSTTTRAEMAQVLYNLLRK